MGIFHPASKEASKLRLAITGPAGSGKTWTSLVIASGIGGRIALLDTEHGSAAKYADEFSFDTVRMKAPFHPDRYCKTIEAAVAEGYDVLIIDSLTHAWKGQGGLLEIVDEIAARKYRSNGFAAWKEADPIQRNLVETILRADIHIIATMRSKMDYVQTEDDRGKKKIEKMGMAPEQREGMEYEFDVVMDMDVMNTATVTKSRCPLLAGARITKPDEGAAHTLLAWLNNETPRQSDEIMQRAAAPARSAQKPEPARTAEPQNGLKVAKEYTVPAEPALPQQQPPRQHSKPDTKATDRPAQNGAKRKISEAQGKRFFAIARNGGLTETGRRRLLAHYGFEHSNEITTDVYEEICAIADDKAQAGRWNADPDQAVLEIPAESPGEEGFAPMEPFSTDDDLPF